METDVLLNLEDYTLLERIGSGNSGEVFIIEEKKTKETFAAKCIYQTLKDNKKDENLFLNREINIMRKINHPNIVKFKGISTTNFYKEEKLVIVSELLSNGSLEDVIRLERQSKAPSNWTATKKLINIYGIASAMAYLHSNDIIHRDLKPGNILMDIYLFPKITDFGLAKAIKSDDTILNIQSEYGTKGTPSYMAPEIFDSNEYSKASDVYAFGFIVYEIITNRELYKDITNNYKIAAEVTSGNRPSLDDVPDIYHAFIEACWNQIPSERPSFDKIIEIMRNDPDFITDEVNEEDFLNYVKYVDESKSSYDSAKPIISILDIIENKTDTFNEAVLNKQTKDEKIILFNKVNQIINDFENNKKFTNDETDEIITLANKLSTGDGVNVDKQTASKLYKIAADNNNAEAMFEYSKIQYQGIGVPIDKSEGFLYCKKAADQNLTKAIYQYAFIVTNDPDFIIFKKDKVKYYKKAADNGHLISMYNYANCVLSGDSIEINKEEAAKYFKMSADLGYPESMQKYGSMLRNGVGLPINKQEAAKYFKGAIDKGNITALNYYAAMLRKGEGIPQDKKEAAKYYKLAADRGSIHGMRSYAKMLDFGNGIPRDYEKAKKYYKAASKMMEKNMNPEELENKLKEKADNGDVESMKEYGLMLKKRVGIKYKPEAAKYLKMAADKGNMNSMILLAQMLEFGDGIPVDKEEAKKYYKLAEIEGKNILNSEDHAIQLKEKADNGDIKAMDEYGLILRDGKGIPKNIKEALKYFKMAADKGNIDSMIHVAQLYNPYDFYEIHSDLEEMLKYYKMAIDNGDLRCLGEYGYFLSSKDKKEGMKYIQMGIDKEQLSSFRFYGIMLSVGIKIECDKQKAADYFKIGADKGDIECMIRYALMLYSGDGIEINKQEAARYYKKSADKGNFKSMFDYALLCLKGDGITVDKQEAAIYFKKLADEANKFGLIYYGLMLYYGDGIEANKKEAIKYFKIGSDRRDIECMYCYAMMLYNGEEMPVDKQRAAYYFKKCANKDTKYSKIKYAMMLYKGDGIESNKQDAYRYITEAYRQMFKNDDSVYIYSIKEKEFASLREEFVNLIKKIADEGDVLFISRYAQLLYDCNQIKTNFSEAIKYFQIGADKGSELCMYRYGMILYEGKHVKCNKEESAKYLKMSADKGYTSAMAKYGQMLYNGDGVIANKKEAIKYIKKAADDGDEVSMNNYGYLLLLGDEISVNKKEAAEYFIKAIDGYSSSARYDSMYNYAMMLLTGDGIEIDKEEAIKYLNKAKSYDHKMAIDVLNSSMIELND